MATSTAGSIANWMSGLTGGQAQAQQQAQQSATAAMAQQLTQAYPQWYIGNGSSATGISGVPGQSIPTPAAPQQWQTWVDDTTVPKDKIEELKKEIMKEFEVEFADLHNKLDKMNEILLSLVKVDVPIDEIKEALKEI